MMVVRIWGRFTDRVEARGKGKGKILIEDYGYDGGWAFS
jgi:hypothetical protein